MSSFSLFSSSHKCNHNVFLSFCGPDTRDGLISHLCAALRRKSIEPFMDSDMLRGEEMTQAIVSVIEQSAIAVVVFSRGYAASTWCLDELVKIMSCNKKHGQTVIPVFYHVDPNDVKDPTSGVFATEFARHAESFKERLENVEEWKASMIKAGNLTGLDSQVIWPDAKLVDNIVDVILKKLEETSSVDLDDIVGIDSHIAQIKQKLSIGLSDVRIVGIWGMGGIGKTTIARVLYNHIAKEFETCCFLASIGEESAKSGGLIRLGEQLLSTIFGKTNIKINTPIIGDTFYVHLLCRKKVLVVLDGVNHSKQLEALAGKTSWFGPGSRIIITSRDKQVFGKNDIYEVAGLIHNEALRLFSQNAFKQKCLARDFQDLSKLAVQYANDNPLALKVLGSFLSGKSQREWECALTKLKKSPNKDIQIVLKNSYDELDDEEKDIFLHIACFFHGEDKNRVTRLLAGCGFSIDIGLRVLIDKSLVTISSDDEVEMHDLLREMGLEIVRKESKEPGKRSRLWNHVDIYQVFKKNSGTDAIEGIFLDMSMAKEVHLSPNAFARMTNLKLLSFYVSTSQSLGECCKVHLSQGLESLPDELRCLYWSEYPLEYLPSNFEPSELIELRLPHSKLKQLWKETKNLERLRELDLRYSQQLIKLPHLSLASNLMSVDLGGCTNLRKVPSSIKHLSQLSYLNLRDCKNIRSLPSTVDLISLETLDLSGCSKLNMFPEVSKNIKELLLDGTAIKKVPFSAVGCLHRLLSLSMRHCKSLSSLPSNIWKLRSLEHLYLDGSLNLENLSEVSETLDEFESSTSAISTMDSSENSFEMMPASTGEGSQLKILDISHCTRIRSLPYLPSTIQQINANYCTSLETIYALEQYFSKCPVMNNYERFEFSCCLKLDTNTWRKIVSNVKFRMQRMANSPQYSFHLCYAGSEIPDWFTYQNMGKEMTIQLPQNCTNDTLLGFASCVVVASNGNGHVGRGILSVNYKFQFKNINGDCNDVYTLSAFTWWSINESMKAENVILWYQREAWHNFRFSEHCSYEASFQFSLQYLCSDVVCPEHTGGLVNGCYIKKCGIVPINYNDKQCRRFETSIHVATGMRSSTVEGAKNKRCQLVDFYYHQDEDEVSGGDSSNDMEEKSRIKKLKQDKDLSESSSN